MKGQLQRLGISYAWEREIATCTPEYYHWNQWLFIRMFERGLAYRRRSTVNWCPSCQTVLANEQVVDGGCWRCGTPVDTRELEQWFFRITAYADELLDGASRADAVARQGPDDAAELDRAVAKARGSGFRSTDDPARRAIEVFTTRIDTIFGATFVMLAPEHPLVEQFADAVRRIPAACARRRRRSARRIAPRG